MKTAERERLGKESGEIARAETLRHCKAIKLTPRLVLRRIKEGLDAIQNDVFYDKDRGKCVVGPDMVNYKARSKSIDQAMSVLGIMAPEKHDVKVGLTLEDIVAGGSDDKP